ncbi:MAG: DUF465 domain-containing protein [Pseudomonadota bacterium]
MSMADHLDALRSKHANLEKQIAEERHRPLPDQTTLVKLKKEKLKIKEAIEIGRVQ